MTHSQLEKELYQAMKTAAKARKIKLSAQHDLYKKSEPYFFNAYYNIRRIENEKIYIDLHISAKYLRFDEMQYGILNPGGTLRFTDKLRANCVCMCRSCLTKTVQSFDYKDTEGALPSLCEEILNFIEKYYRCFFAEINENYGDLAGYYIANRDTLPRLAGLAYLDKGDYQNAAECFSHPEMDGKNQIISANITTAEQHRRAKANGIKIFCSSYGKSIHRSEKDIFADYADALRIGLEWTENRAIYGLLPKERKNHIK